MSFFSANPLRSSAYPLLPLHNAPPSTPGTGSARASAASPRSPRSSPSSPGAAAAPSILRSPPSPRHTASGTNDTLLALARQTAHLERALQSHLDAQSAGLLAGLGRPDSPDAPSILSTDPLSPSSPDPAAPLSLAQARRAIRSTLLRLADTKAAEAAALAAAQAPVAAFLANLDGLAARRAGLDAKIDELGGGEGQARLQALAREEEALALEVRQLEDALAAKRARLAHVRRRSEADGSRRDAALSSWRHARDEVDARIAAEVLSGRGAPDMAALRATGSRGPSRSTSRRRDGSRPPSSGGGDPVDAFALPPSRRTLDLVRASLAAAQDAAQARCAAARHEADACAQGADVWAGAARAARTVEREVAREIANLAAEAAGHDPLGAGPVTPLAAPPDAPPADASGRGSPSPSGSGVLGTDATASFATARSRAGRGASEPPRDGPGDGMRGVLQLMDRAAGALAADARLARRRAWVPLVCAIGAELEALREGRRVLAAALGLEEEGGEDGEDHGEAEGSQARDDTQDKGKGKGKEKAAVLFDAEDNDEPSADLLVETHAAAEEDGGPGPGLLFEPASQE